jgi:hypothetical protein
VKLWLVAALVAAPAGAHAEPESPTFVELGPDGIATQAGADLGLAYGVGDERTIERVALSGQIVGGTGAGGYLAMSGAHGAGIGTGGLDLGGLYRGRATGVDVTMRFGLVIPTSHDYYYDGGGTAERDGTAAVHPADIATTAPGVTALRLAVSPMLRRGGLFVRLELGADTAVGGDQKADAGTTVHADLGVGFVHGRLGGTLEVAVVRYHLVRSYDRMVGLAATFQYRRGRWRPYAGLATLLGRDDLGDPYLGLVTGVRMRFSL